jgi:hypothetical protein
MSTCQELKNSLQTQAEIAAALEAATRLQEQENSRIARALADEVAVAAAMEAAEAFELQRASVDYGDVRATSASGGVGGMLGVRGAGSNSTGALYTLLGTTAAAGDGNELEDEMGVDATGSNLSYGVEAGGGAIQGSRNSGGSSGGGGNGRMRSESTSAVGSSSAMKGRRNSSIFIRLPELSGTSLIRKTADPSSGSGTGPGPGGVKAVGLGLAAASTGSGEGAFAAASAADAGGDGTPLPTSRSASGGTAARTGAGAGAGGSVVGRRGTGDGSVDWSTAVTESVDVADPGLQGGHLSADIDNTAAVPANDSSAATATSTSTSTNRADALTLPPIEEVSRLDESAFSNDLNASMEQNLNMSMAVPRYQGNRTAADADADALNLSSTSVYPSEDYINHHENDDDGNYAEGQKDHRYVPGKDVLHPIYSADSMDDDYFGAPSAVALFEHFIVVGATEEVWAEWTFLFFVFCLRFFVCLFIIVDG